MDGRRRRRQVIFEHNVIRPAGTELAWGNNIDNYENGYAQHVYHANNDFQCEWGAAPFGTSGVILDHPSMHSPTLDYVTSRGLGTAWCLGLMLSGRANLHLKSDGLPDFELQPVTASS